MKDNKKLFAILESVAVIALGVLLAIFGFRTVDLYFGIMFIVAAVAFLSIVVAYLVKSKEMPFGPLLGFSSALVFGILILLSRFSLAFLFDVFVLLIIAFGGALLIYGIYLMVKGATVYGVGQLVIGILLFVSGILYLTVPDFRVAFWIIVGVLVAIYGVLLLVEAIAGKKLTKK